MRDNVKIKKAEVSCDFENKLWQKEQEDCMMKINALMMDSTDNVVTCVTEVAKGETVVYMQGEKVCTITALDDIPYCHKIAVKDIGKGEAVIKYGESLGETSEKIEAGRWVADHNLFSVPRDYEGEMAGDHFEMSARQSEGAPEMGSFRFWGYRRAEGRPGIRNHVLILPTCACGSESCRIVASQVRGAVNIILTTKHTALTASPGFIKSLNLTFPGSIIMELAGIAIGVQTATLLAMNTAITTALGSAPRVSAMVQAIGQSRVHAAVLLITCVSAQVRIHNAAIRINGLEFPVSETTASAIIFPAPVSFSAFPRGIINASIKTVRISKEAKASFSVNTPARTRTTAPQQAVI